MEKNPETVAVHPSSEGVAAALISSLHVMANGCYILDATLSTYRTVAAIVAMARGSSSTA